MSDHTAVHRCGCPADGGPLGKLLDLVIQRGLHHRWCAHPEEVPFAHRGLAAEVTTHRVASRALTPRKNKGVK